jgi:glutathione S-transferase
MTATLILYGHPFSSYTWKALIALYASELEFDVRAIDAQFPEHITVVQSAGPLGKFPVLEEGENLIFEATSIIEYLAIRHPGPEILIPTDPAAAVGIRMLDRVFDNYVMAPMQEIVGEHIRNPEAPDQTRIAEAKASLRKSYAWIEGWLEYYPVQGQITLVECAAAPSLFYADWVEQIGDEFPRLKQWRTHLLSLEPVVRCVEDARPYRVNFPMGAPDRD